jgi:hypothetical protein
MNVVPSKPKKTNFPNDLPVKQFFVPPFRFETGHYKEDIPFFSGMIPQIPPNMPANVYFPDPFAKGRPPIFQVEKEYYKGGMKHGS